MLYDLYFIVSGIEEFYGHGDMKYMMELLQDYLEIHKMYNKSEIVFKIKEHKFD